MAKATKNFDAWEIRATEKTGEKHVPVIAYGEKEVNRIRKLHTKYGATVEVERRPDLDKDVLELD